jgi:hypothetical protein
LTRSDALAGGRRQGPMKLVMGHRPAAVVLLLGVVSHLGHVTLQPRKVLGRHMRDGQPHRFRLERNAHHVQLLEVRRRDRRDAHPAIRLTLDESLALQHPQGLSERCPADAQLVGKRHLRHHRPGCQDPVKDRCSHPLVHVLCVLPVFSHIGQTIVLPPSM